MNYKNIFRASIGVLSSLLLLFGCTNEAFEEVTTLNLSRCLEPQNLSGRIDAAYGDVVTFAWDVNKDADAYSLVVYKDEAMTSVENSWDLAPREVPFTTRLTADQKYWFTVQAYRVNEEGVEIASTFSNVAVYDGSLKTYAVKDNLFPEIVSRTAHTLVIGWDKTASDYSEVTHLSAVPVKGGKTIKHELSAAEKTNAVATVDGLEPSTEYQVVLFYMSASRGALDLWTVAEPGSATYLANSEELKTAVATGGEYVLQTGTYAMGTAKPASSLTLIGMIDADGKRPVVNGSVDISSVLAAGSDLRFENLAFIDDGSNSYTAIFSDAAAAAQVGKLQFVNCEIAGYKSGIFNANKAGGLTVDEILFDSCDIHGIIGSGGDGFDVRQATSIASVKFVNNTIYDGFRTFVRIDAKDDITIGSFTFTNNTVKGISVMDDGNNQGLFAFKVPTTMTLKDNIFLWEDGGKTAEGEVDRCQLFRDNTAIVVPTLTASGNYSYAQGKDFFLKVSAAEAGCKVMNVDPCYNSKGNFFQLAAQDLIEAQTGASKWWISYTEKPEDLTQGVITDYHVWNLQDASLFAGEVKNSRVRDELMLVGTEATPINADSGINFLQAAVLNRSGLPVEGYVSFKINAPGSVDMLLADKAKTGGSVIVALADDNGLEVQGSVAVSSANPEIQKVVIPKVSGEGTVYLYPSAAVSMTKLAWSLDTKAGSKILATPKPAVDPVTLTEGDATEVGITWNAVDNAGSYIVIFNKRAHDPQTELSFTVPAEDIAELKAGLYSFSVQALPREDDIYYLKSDQGVASFAIQPKASGGEVVEVTRVWDFSQADWQAEFAKYGAVNTDITGWDIVYDDLTIHSGSKSKYNTTFFQFGGKSGDMDRYFAFTAPEQGTLKITVSNTGSSEALDRTVQVAVGDDVQSLPGGFSSNTPTEIEFSIKAGQVVITAPVNGLRFYKIEYNYSYVSGGGAAPVEYDWDFSGADWQAAFATYGAVNTDITNWDLTLDGLTIHSGSKSKYNTTFFQFGGKSGDMDRYFAFTAPDQGTLKITVSNTGSAEALDRTVQVAVGDDVQAQPGGFSSNTPGEIEFAVKAGDVVITAPVNGLRFYRIYYTNK